MRRHSFFFKLFFGNLLLVGVIVLLGGGLSYRSLQDSYQEEGKRRQARLSRIIQSHVEGLWPETPAEIDRYCKELFEQETLRLTVIDADGRVLGDSEAAPARMENHRTSDRPEVMGALRGEPTWAVRTSETLGIPFRYRAVPLRHDGRTVGAVRLAMPRQAILQDAEFVRGALLWAAMAAIVAAVMLALLVSWVWYAPLRQITREARRIASGDLSKRARMVGSDELAELAAALNDMRDSLARQIETIASQRESLQTVVSNLREGVVALDARGTIVQINAAAIEMLARDTMAPAEAAGRHLQSVVRSSDVVDASVQALENPSVVDRQVEVDVPHRGRRILDLHVAPISGESRLEIASLLVVRDVTDLAKAGTMKAEFAANASHELRTPLATIRAATESLEAIDAADQESFRKFVGMLNRHVGRLENLTQDLLDLHKVESPRLQLRRERISLNSLVVWADEHFAEQADERGIAFDVLADEPAREFSSDRTLIHLILQNLIDNALKFTPSGGRVECALETRPDSILLRVTDTGCGIAPELQSRVFERFFQADTVRGGTAEVRGTGLGLAIVKHAADRLGATVSLQSEPGRGTAVTVEVPR